MRCSRCGRDLEKGWRFCPVCGYRAGGRDDLFSGDFDSMLKRLVRQINDEMSRMLERDVEVFDISPLLRGLGGKGRGFRIKITRKGDERPRVDVKSFGDRDAARDPGKRLPAGAGPGAVPEPPLKEPAFTEEPLTSVRREDSSVVVEMRVPGVKSAGDIEVAELEKSVEVKAVVGDRAYFKIVTKPPSHSLRSRELKDGVLRLVFS